MLGWRALRCAPPTTGTYEPSIDFRRGLQKYLKYKNKYFLTNIFYGTLRSAGPPDGRASHAGFVMSLSPRAASETAKGYHLLSVYLDPRRAKHVHFVMETCLLRDGDDTRRK